MYLITPPAEEPVTVGEAALAARIDDDAFADILTGLITSARQMAEHELGDKLISQTWREELTDWPASIDPFEVYRPTAVAVTYWDGATWQPLAGVVAFAVGRRTSIVPALNTTYPTLGDIAGGPRVRIDFTIGQPTAATVPEAIKTWIKAQVAYWIRNPEAANDRKAEVNPFLSGLLQPWVIYQ